MCPDMQDMEITNFIPFKHCLIGEQQLPQKLWVPDALFQTPLAKSYTARQILQIKALYTLQMIWIQPIFV
jgi:hypothetical protein